MPSAKHGMASFDSASKLVYSRGTLVNHLSELLDNLAALWSVRLVLRVLAYRQPNLAKKGLGVTIAKRA